MEDIQYYDSRGLCEGEHMTEGVDEPYYCPICGAAWDCHKCMGCGFVGRCDEIPDRS